MMKFTDKQLRILATLSDEVGYSTTKLAIIIEGDKNGKGNMSKSLKPMIDNKIIDNLQAMTSFREYNLHIRDDIIIFSSIITELEEIYTRHHLESAKLGEKFKMLEKRDGWGDDRMIALFGEMNENSELYQSSKDLLLRFRCSAYTVKMIKKYGIEDTLKAIPMMTVEDFINFVDWAYENGFIDTEFYDGFVFSLSPYMVNQFEKKSKEFAELLASVYENEVNHSYEEVQDREN